MNKYAQDFFGEKGRKDGWCLQKSLQEYRFFQLVLTSGTAKQSSEINLSILYNFKILSVDFKKKKTIFCIHVNFEKWSKGRFLMYR